LVTLLRRYDKLSSSMEGGLENSETEEGKTEVFKATFGDLTWIGREFVNDEGKKVYQAVKIDELGNESIVYEVLPNPYGSGVEWKFDHGSHDLVQVEGIRAYSEGGSTTKIGFRNGEETIRLHYDQYGSFQNNLRFELPDSPLYTVTLLASGACEGQIPDNNYDNLNELTHPQTELTGVEITSEEGSQVLKLEE